MKKQYGIRLFGDVAATVENFADVHKMSKTAAAEFFVKMGIESLTKDARLEARFNGMEEHMRLVYSSLARSLISIQLLNPPNKEVMQAISQEAEQRAVIATTKIFGE